MKTQLIISAVLSVLLYGCGGSETGTPEAKPVTTISVLDDRTENFEARPDAESILELYGINDGNINDGYVLRYRQIGDVSLQSVSQFSVEPVGFWTTDQTERVGTVRVFEKQVTEFFKKRVSRPKISLQVK